MYVNLKTLVKAPYITFFRRPFGLRRWLWTFLVLVLFVVWWSLLALGRALDHVLFPGFRRQPVHKPVFIVGAPRSGTTLMQNLMSLDEEQFTHFRLYQTLFPCVLYQRVFDFLFPLGRRRSRISEFTQRFETTFFNAWHHMHALRFDKPEEDEGLFVSTMMSEAIYLLFPYFDQLPEVGFPDRLPERGRRRLMRHYDSCLRRHLYVSGPRKILLSKSTSFAGRVEAMLEAFPDARVIHLVRHPYECIPSHVSLFWLAWNAHSPEIMKDSPESKAYAQLAVDWYRSMLENRGKFDDDRYVCVRYVDLLKDPLGTIERVYAHLGFDLTPATRERLESAVEHTREFNSMHSYSLEEYGLSKRWIQDQLGDVLSAYGFDT